MGSVFYQRYKLAIWILIGVLSASGVVSNWYYGSALEVGINGGLSVFSLGMIGLTMAQRSKKKK